MTFFKLYDYKYISYNDSKYIYVLKYMRTFRTLFFIEIKLMCSTKGFQLDAQTDRNLWMGSRDPENLDIFKKKQKTIITYKRSIIPTFTPILQTNL